jgi:hypothetical protein
MVDPATQLDQGGNPLQEGVWANIDGGWQPSYKRDEFFAKIANMSEQDLYQMMADAQMKAEQALRMGDMGEHLRWGAEYHHIADAIAQTTGQDPRPADDLPNLRQGGGRGPFDMRGDPYPLPSGGQGQYYKCPNCQGQMNADDGECYRCGYTYPYDGGEVLHGHDDPTAWARDMGVPVAPGGLGPVRQGKLAGMYMEPSGI